MRTYSTKASDIQRKWHVLDASDQILGRVATRAASLLMGKHKPIFSHHLDTGDFVIVINAAKVRVTGNKMEDKVYYSHSMYPGGLKSINLAKLLETHPDRVIKHAVKGMLPHNSLGAAMIKKLKVYAGSEHPHEAQLGGKKKSAKQTEENKA